MTTPNQNPTALPEQRPPMKWGFWLLWGFDALVGLVALGFFIGGLFDGSVSNFNLTLWVTLLLCLGGVLGGGFWLRVAGQRILAVSLLLLLALPTALCALLFVVVLLIGPGSGWK